MPYPLCASSLNPASPMAEPSVLKGRSAAEGFASGRIAVMRESAGQRRSEEPAAGENDLRQAIGQAASQLKELAGRTEGAGAEILEFQAEMLEDPSLAEPAWPAIRAGTAADEAWRQAVGFLIEEFGSDSDDTLRARSADLEDLRDRVLRCLANEQDEPIASGAIVHARDLKPSSFLAADWSGGGLALAEGSAASHVAILARARDVPMVTGLGWHPDIDGREVLLDAGRGMLTVDPSERQRSEHAVRLRDAAAQADQARKHLYGQARTAAGDPVKVMVNVASPGDVADVDPAVCDGIGLARTEFLFAGTLAGEDEQYACYRKLAQWAAGRPVALRTLDAGGDKPIPGYTRANERNPFLGVRGLRLSLLHPDVFRTQLRAMLRAAAAGRVRIMLPMVTKPSELAQAREHLQRASEELAAVGREHADAELGIMVEVPAAAMGLAGFDADFYSIGSNDLTQYVTACSRDEGELADLADPADGAVLELISRTVAEGNRQNADVSLCGDMAADPAHAARLLGCGLRSLSVAPARVGTVKAAIAAA